MEYETTDYAFENAIFFILAIGSQNWHILHRFGMGKCLEGITFVPVLCADDSAPSTEADYAIRLSQESLSYDANGNISQETRFELAKYFDERFARADAVLILTDMDNPDNLRMANCICQYLTDITKRNRYGLTLVFLARAEIENMISESKQLSLDYYQILNCADTLILPTNARNQHSLETLSKVDTHSPSNRIAYDCCLAMNSIIEVVWQKGLNCFEFADIYSAFAHRGETRFAIGYGRGEKRSREAATEAVKLLEETCGNLNRFVNGAMLVTISATDIDFAEFNEVGDIIHQNLHETTLIKIGTILDTVMPDGAMRVTLFVN